MSFSQQKFREMTFQLLFSLDMGDCLEEDLIPFLMSELTVSKKNVRTSLEKARQIMEKRSELDAIISSISRDYALERIQRVERNVLRLALYEMIVEKELEEKIIISEALRLCRKFSTPESSSYVNAILDEYSLSLREEPAAI